MPCSCVGQTELPHTSALYGDVLHHPERTAPFYRHPIRNLDAYRAVAGEMRFSDEQRSALVAALRIQNPQSQALDRLAASGTVAVLTGQQVGLFSGPAYTIFKVLHAAKLAAWLTAQGLPAVPIFWLATEDHDFAEVNHAWVFNAEHRPAKVEMRHSAAAQPVGDVILASVPLDELRAGMQGLPFADEVADMAAAAYRPGTTMGGAFGALLRRILAGFDIPQVDPMLPAFRSLAVPVLRAAVKAGPELTRRVLDRDRELAAAGYHAQVHVEESTSFIFLLEGGKRLALRRHDRDYLHNGRRFSFDELAERAESLSPNALLRPVVQDSMMPTVAYIGGPAEVAYLAQSEALYSVLLDRMPVATPRSGFTLLDARSAKLLERYGLNLEDFFRGEDALRERIGAKLVPPALQGAMRQITATVEGAEERFRDQLAGFDPTLVRALDLSAKKIAYQFRKIEGKAGREILRRDARAARDAASLGGLIYPERHVQERLYSILPFLAAHGLDLIGRIYDAIDLDCADHQMLVV